MATRAVWMPIGIATTDRAVDVGYSATVLPNSEVPALLGLTRIQNAQAVLDLRSRGAAAVAAC